MLKKKNKKKRMVDIKWIIIVTICAFVMSTIFSSIMELVTNKLSLILGAVLIIGVIIVGVLFDIVGVAITACDIKPFNSMASKKVRGSKTAIELIKNKEKVSAFCNDVVGDVCGVVSGSVGIILAVMISDIVRSKSIIITVMVTAIISALTIGSKALGKSYAISKSEKIIFRFSKVVSFFKKEAK